MQATTMAGEGLSRDRCFMFSPPIELATNHYLTARYVAGRVQLPGGQAMSEDVSNRGLQYGVYRAVAADTSAPEARGRLAVLLEGEREAWAKLATLLAGDGYGTWFHPEAGDEVLVAFEGKR